MRERFDPWLTASRIDLLPVEGTQGRLLIQAGDRQRQLAGSILRQAFGGSAHGLLQSALAGRKVDAKELAEIRQLLDDYEKRGGK